MKSLSILMVIVSFATSLANYQVQVRISDYDPKNATVSIIEGDTLKLSCEPNLLWEECEFKHESNGKSCKKFYTSVNVIQQCENGTGEMYQKDGSCVIEVKDLKKEDAGNWTCKISLSNSNNDTHHVFNVEVQDKPLIATATRLTEVMAFSIFAFTFLILF